jgi:hypothetical protein
MGGKNFKMGQPALGKITHFYEFLQEFNFYVDFIAKLQLQQKNYKLHVMF